MYGAYPTWGNKYEIYDNNNIGMSLTEHYSAAVSYDGRLATNLEI